MKNLHTFVILAYKKSLYLEKNIKSVLNQTVKSKVIIATSTPNEFISNLSKKYDLPLIINKNGSKGIGHDFDFALSCANTKLVTIAHQDDIYDKDYAKTVINYYKKYSNISIIFTSYYEIKDNIKVSKNINLFIKKILLSPLKLKFWSGLKFIKRLVLRFGCPICCPAVTFVKEKTKTKVFSSDLKCNIDWLAWERLSKKDGKFIYINKKLMGHRVHEESTTTQIIKENTRTKEDYLMFCKFWPKSLATILTKFYKNSEKANNLKN